ncbi:MAG: hypothetical protein Q8Q07_02070 [Dehalococcoidales bacterium]|nr:hypothetical protein [Dehalococcoidales bacterium]
MKRYEHTQVGYLVIIAMVAAIVLVGTILANTGTNWIAVAVLIIVAVFLLLFSTLTVVIREDDLKVRFGPGLVRKRFNLHDIESCRVVKNPFYYGWGIRLTPHGWLYNVSGFSAVEIKLRTGKKFRIGTDVPMELERAIQQATGSQ